MVECAALLLHTSSAGGSFLSTVCVWSSHAVIHTNGCLSIAHSARVCVP